LARRPLRYTPRFDDPLPAAGGRLISATIRHADVTDTTESPTSAKTDITGRGLTDPRCLPEGWEDGTESPVSVAGPKQKIALRFDTGRRKSG
jgi:hypothetical protein